MKSSLLFSCLLAGFLCGCGGNNVSVSIIPGTTQLDAGAAQQFTVSVTHTRNTAVTWSVSAGIGTISTSGLFTAPAQVASQTTATVTATSQADTRRWASATVTIMPVAVQVAPGTVQLNGGETHQFSASVTHSANTAVTWTITSGGGTISSSGLYTAPAVISSQTTATITATSEADDTKTGTATITLMPVVVQVSPSTPTVSLLGTRQFTATVTGSTNTAVTWSVTGTGCTGGECGTIDSAGLYTGPWCVPSPATVSVTATSVADPTKTASAVATTAVAASGVGGRYAFLFQGTDADGLMFTAGSFSTDGSGNITDGVEDVVRMSRVDTSVTFTGSYDIHCYNRATVTFNDSLGRTQTFAAGLNSTGDRARFIELDSTGIRGSGMMAKQDPTALGTSQFSGDYAFAFAGSRAPANSLGRVGLVGRFHADGAGVLSPGTFDFNVDGTNTADAVVAGIYSVSATTGRGTATLQSLAMPHLRSTSQPNAVLMPQSYHLSFYVVSAAESFWISTDAAGATTDIFGGRTLQQSGGPFTVASLNATGVLSLTGKNQANQNSDVVVATVTPDGAGAIAGGPLDRNFDTTLSSYTSTSGTYTVDAGGSGRGTLHLDEAAGVSTDLTFYLISPNAAFVLEGTGTVDGPSVQVGMLEPRTDSPYSVASFSGTYYFGTEGIATHYVPVMCGAALADGAGQLGGMGDESDIFGQSPDVSMFVGSYQIPANGRIEFDPLVFYMVSARKGIVFEMDGNQHQPSVIVIEK